jgi:type IV fimbrial biogenesis protein FimT
MLKKTAGFTLIELLIVVTILGILAAVGTPSLQFLISSYRLKTASSDLHTTLVLTRSEAVKRNETVTITPTSTSDWSQGWTVALGSNVISIQDPYPSLSFSPRNAAFGSKTVNSVTFNGTGRENSTDGVAFVITSSALSTLPARCVILDPSGRPSVRVDKDNDTSDGCN